MRRVQLGHTDSLTAVLVRARTSSVQRTVRQGRARVRSKPSGTCPGALHAALEASTRWDGTCAGVAWSLLDELRVLDTLQKAPPGRPRLFAQRSRCAVSGWRGVEGRGCQREDARSRFGCVHASVLSMVCTGAIASKCYRSTKRKTCGCTASAQTGPRSERCSRGRRTGSPL